MIAKTLVATLFLSSVALATDSTTNGLAGSFDVSVLEQAKDVYFNEVLSLINGLEIPDFEQDKHDYIRQNSLVINSNPQNVEFSVDTANNALVLTCNDITGQFVTKEFSVKEFIFIATGLAEVDLNQITLALGVQFTTQTLADGRVVPAVEAVDVVVDINRDDLKFHIHGNIWTDMASVFVPLFKGAILDAVTGAINTALQTTAPTLANSFIAKTDAMTQIIPDLYLDWATAQPFYVTETSLEFGARAILFDSDFGEQLPAEWPTMPYKDTAQPAQFQVFLSDEAVNAAFASLLEVHPVHGWLNSTMVPSSAPISLTTGYLDKAFKGISAYYGPDQPVNVWANLTNVYGFTVTAGDQEVSMNADLSLQFYVETTNGTTELAVDLTLGSLIADATILIDGFNVTGNFTKLKVQNLVVNSCAFGKISTFQLKLELNVALAVAAGPLNKALNTLVIPDNVLGIFQLSDLVIDYYDGFLFAGATPTFLAPTITMDDLAHDAAYAMSHIPEEFITG